MLNKLLFPYLKAPWKEVNLTKELTELKTRKNWLKTLENKYQSRIYGGYLENRSQIFDSRHIPERIIHVGNDYWLPENSEIYSPINGEIIYLRSKSDEEGGWGGRIDILSNNNVWLFGHLHNTDLVKISQTIKIGDLISILGGFKDNGGWRPHLHLQVMNFNFYKRFNNPEEIDCYSINLNNIDKYYLNPSKLI